MRGNSHLHNKYTKMIAYYEILFGIATVLLALYYYFTWHFDFWKLRNVPGPKPVPVFGNVFRLMFGKECSPEFQVRIRQKYPNEPMVGLFDARTPVLILQDPDHIKDVLVQNFSKFQDRVFPLTEKVNTIEL